MRRRLGLRMPSAEFPANRKRSAWGQEGLFIERGGCCQGEVHLFCSEASSPESSTRFRGPLRQIAERDLARLVQSCAHLFDNFLGVAIGYHGIFGSISVFVCLPVPSIWSHVLFIFPRSIRLPGEERTCTNTVFVQSSGPKTSVTLPKAGQVPELTSSMSNGKKERKEHRARFEDQSVAGWLCSETSDSIQTWLLSCRLPPNRHLRMRRHA